MENIILTGVNSFLGKSLIEDLIKFYHVRCLVRQESKCQKSLKVDYYKINFINPVFDKTLFDNVYAVVHVLSLKSASHPDILSVNVDFTKKLINAAKTNHVEKFVYISSETVQLSGEDLYTKSKRLAEEIVLRYKNYLIFRPTVIYGESDKSNIGFLINLMKYLPVVPVIGTGSQLMQPVYVKDISKCIISGLLNDISGTYLVAGHNSLQYKEIIDIISKALGKKRLNFYLPIRAGYILAKLSKMLGFSFIQKSQIDNLMIDRKYSVGDTEKLFQIRFVNPKEQIYKLVKEINE